MGSARLHARPRASRDGFSPSREGLPRRSQSAVGEGLARCFRARLRFPRGGAPSSRGKGSAGRLVTSRKRFFRACFGIAGSSPTAVCDRRGKASRARRIAFFAMVFFFRACARASCARMSRRVAAPMRRVPSRFRRRPMACHGTRARTLARLRAACVREARREGAYGRVPSRFRACAGVAAREGPRMGFASFLSCVLPGRSRHAARSTRDAPARAHVPASRGVPLVCVGCCVYAPWLSSDGACERAAPRAARAPMGVCPRGFAHAPA